MTTLKRAMETGKIQPKDLIEVRYIHCRTDIRAAEDYTDTRECDSLVCVGYTAFPVFMHTYDPV